DEFGVLVPERHIVGGGGQVFPGAVIVLLRPAREDLNVRDRLAVHAVEPNIVSDTTVDLNACICHFVFLLCFVALKKTPTGMVEAVGCVLVRSWSRLSLRHSGTKPKCFPCFYMNRLAASRLACCTLGGRTLTR